MRRHLAAAEDALARAQQSETPQSEDLLGLVLEAARIGSWNWNLQTGEIALSDELEAFLGMAPGAFAGHSDALLEYIHCQDREEVLRAVRRDLDAAADYDVEFRPVYPEETERWARAWGRVFFDSRGKPWCAIGVVMDITQQKALEDQLQQAQRLEAIGRLAGGVAHDFNNLLTVITGYAELILADRETGGKWHSEIRDIKVTADRATELVGQLLAFGRKQRIAPKVLNLNAVLEEVERMLRRLISENIGIVTVLGKDLRNVRVDPGQIEQVVVNLAINARDAMGEDGTLTIETANVVLDAASVRDRPDLDLGVYVKLTVKDTGCGMDPETLAHIFEPFFSTKEVGLGTGLGLSTVYGIVKQYGGTIEVQSEPDRGSKFEIYLPETSEAIEPAPPAQAPETPDRGAETILLVEDETDVRILMHRILTQAGYTVLETGDPEQALALCAASETPIQMLLTDVEMPAMNGGELAQRLVDQNPQMRVLYISGFSENASIDSGLEKSGQAFLQKPFTPNGLIGKVRQVLDGD